MKTKTKTKTNTNTFKLSHLITACLLPLSGLAIADTINVYNASDLQNALKSASAGDEIIVNSGTYTGNKGTSGNAKAHFFSDKSGISSNPITLRSKWKGNKQILKGESVDSGYILYLTGDNWIVKDLKFTTAQKGIMLEGANNNTLNNIEVSNVGAEAVHFRYFSSNNALTNCYIHNTGKRSGGEGFGEAVYVGTHDGHTTEKLDHSNNNLIGGCSIGPNITAEALDIKSGTSGTIIESNYINGKGIIGQSGNPAADSFIDLKGTNVIIRNNKMDYDGDSNFEHGIFTYQEHRSSNIYNNEFTLASNMPTFKLLEETVHAENNVRTDGGTKVVEADYQLRKIDNTLDQSFEKPAKTYTCFDELENGCGSVVTEPGPSEPIEEEGYAGSHNLPGKVEAEHYAAAPTETTTGNANTSEVTQCTYYNLDVDVQNSSDDSTCNVGWSATGEKLDYKVGSAGGTYDINLRASTNSNSKQLKVRVNGTLVGTKTITNGGWSSWNNHVISGVTIPTNATIQVEFVQGGVNLNYLNVTAANTDPVDPVDPVEPTDCSGTKAISWGSKTEVNLATTNCISFSKDLGNETFQAWDSDANSSCNFRGEIESTTNSAVSATVSSNYQVISSLSGKTFKLIPSNNCQYIKVRAY